MSDATPVRTVDLENGLTLNFFDHTNRYFGDFHRVLVVVEGRIDTEITVLSEEQKIAFAVLPDSPLYRRDLERMGVPSDRLQVTLDELIVSFLASAKTYLDRPDIPGQLIEKYLTENKKRRVSLRSIR